MQDNSNFLNNIYTYMETSASTKQQYQPYFLSPFQLLSSNRQLNGQNRVQSRIQWSNNEKLKYSMFLCYFRDLFSNLSDKESINWKVFRGMQKFIGSRNAKQCRSYHLKVMSKFNGLRMFLKLSIRRVNGLRGKMLEVQQELESIQQQFELYADRKKKVGRQQVIMRERENDISGQGQEQQIAELVNNNNVQQKLCMHDKEQNMKTSDTYPIQQNPVNINNCIRNNMNINKCNKNIDINTTDNSIINTTNSSINISNSNINNYSSINMKSKAISLMNMKSNQISFPLIIIDNNSNRCIMKQSLPSFDDVNSQNKHQQFITSNNQSSQSINNKKRETSFQIINNSININNNINKQQG